MRTAASPSSEWTGQRGHRRSPVKKAGGGLAVGKAAALASSRSTSGPLVALPASHSWAVGWPQQVQPTWLDTWDPEKETGISY